MPGYNKVIIMETFPITEASTWAFPPSVALKLIQFNQTSFGECSKARPSVPSAARSEGPAVTAVVAWLRSSRSAALLPASG